MKGVLCGVSGPAKETQAGLKEGFPISVGRSEACSISIPTDRCLSARHFEIVTTAEKVLLSDLGSTNGTFVNGAKVRQQELRMYDTIGAGESVFSVQLGAKLLSVMEVLSNQPEPLYAVLDTARDPVIFPLLLGSGAQYWSLYFGKSATELEAVAPYLVYLPPGSAFMQKIIDLGWSKAWGIYLTSSHPVETIWRELRKSLFVMLENQERVYFRFYDPRVLRTFLPTAELQQLAEFSGLVQSFHFEGENATILLRFSSLLTDVNIVKYQVLNSSAA